LNAWAVEGFFLLMAMPGFFPGFLFTAGIVQGVRESYRQRHPSPRLLAFLEALRLHKLYRAAKAEEDAAAHQADLRKRSYWEFLDGYAFERATAEVLNKHQFNAIVTGGSADGGIDIEVTRNGLKGVVQCKAHVADVGPHIVRDLYGVINHVRADFGIIVSRGGFSRGAIEFARDKPILFLDVTDLIAMQEGKDVLAATFSVPSSSAASPQPQAKTPCPSLYPYEQLPDDDYLIPPEEVAELKKRDAESEAMRASFVAHWGEAALLNPQGRRWDGTISPQKPLSPAERQQLIDRFKRNT
jgi:hypothetical protein